MSTTADADLDELTASFVEGRSLDPEVKKRIRERSERLRQEIAKKHGLLNIAVDLVREIREE